MSTTDLGHATCGICGYITQLMDSKPAPSILRYPPKSKDEDYDHLRLTCGKCRRQVHYWAKPDEMQFASDRGWKVVRMMTPDDDIKIGFATHRGFGLTARLEESITTLRAELDALNTFDEVMASMSLAPTESSGTNRLWRDVLIQPDRHEHNFYWQ